ncbi:hypothetical protein LXA43DRAFT_1095724 [Ganoderma leucocontextum]|nr:hypothetical protein LXA43DRAFT_1095724 [Ganoderma leucocontextum]
MDRTLRKNDYDLPGILGLIGPHLKRISITDWSLQNDEKQHLQTSLSLISIRFPSLQYFYLHCKQPLAVCKLISTALPSNLDDLRTFQCDHVPIAESTFSALGRLQHLSELSIRLPAFLSWAPLPPESFPVKEATIHLRDVPKVHDAVRFFDLISRQFSHAGLSKLSIDMSEDANLISRSRDNKVTLTRDHLRHLLSFTMLAVNLACPYALNGNFCSEITKALPDIECLYIGTYDGCHHDTAPGMLPTMTQVLAPFATHCPKLNILGIPFDARQSLTIDAVRDALPQRPTSSDPGNDP